MFPLAHLTTILRQLLPASLGLLFSLGSHDETKSYQAGMVEAAFLLSFDCFRPKTSEYGEIERLFTENDNSKSCRGTFIPNIIYSSLKNRSTILPYNLQLCEIFFSPDCKLPYNLQLREIFFSPDCKRSYKKLLYKMI